MRRLPPAQILEVTQRHVAQRVGESAAERKFQSDPLSSIANGGSATVPLTA
jgi:hypothetical protein